MPLGRKTDRLINSHNNSSRIKISLSNNIILEIYRKVLKQNHLKEAPVCTCRNEKASFTLEAAVLLPVFACFLVSILFYFRVVQIQSDVGEALQYTGRNLAVYAFADNYDAPLTDNPGISLAAATIMFNSQLQKNGTPTNYVNLGNLGISLLESDFSGDYVDLKATYSMNLPIAMFGKRTILLSQQVKARKWNGYQSGSGTGEDGESWVYVAENGTVYHTDRNCTYLKLSVQSVLAGELESKRNAGGEIYKPCERCCQGAANGVVYITDYGNRYHTDLSCSGLKRSVHMMRLSEAESKGYGCCSKCSGG